MNGLAAAAVIRTLFSSFTHPCECPFCAWMCVFVCAFLCCRWMSLRVFFCTQVPVWKEKEGKKVCENMWRKMESVWKKKKKGRERGVRTVLHAYGSFALPLAFLCICRLSFSPPPSHLLITFSSPVSLHDHFPFISPLKLETLPSFTSSGLLTPTLHSFLQTRASFPISPPFFSSCLPSSSHPSVYFSL